MPTISPQVRASIGGTPDTSQMPRTSLKVGTGMNMPPAKNQEGALPPPKSGQGAPIEETQAPAVTLSPQLTALARKQQKLQQEIAAFKAQQAEFEQQRQNYVPKTDFKTKLQQNAVEALGDLGVNYEELTQLLLDQQNGADPVKRLESKIDQLQKSQEENVNKQYEATLKQYRAETDSLIAQDPKAFHLINKGKHQDAVVQHIVDTWQENPDQVLTVEQAAKEVEEVLRENAKAASDALKELEPPAQETPAKKTLPPPQRPAARTLTQSVETAPTRTYGQFQHMSAKERLAAAIARSQR